MTYRDATPKDAVAYLLAYVIPLLVIGSVWLGRFTGSPDLFAFVPIVVAFGLLPAYQTLFPYRSAQLPPAMAESSFWRGWFRLLPLFAVVPQAIMLYLTMEAFATGGLDWWARIALVVGTGFFSTLFGVNFAHTLMHHREAFDRFMSGLLLSLMSFGSFRIVHMQIHHPHVCTPADFASAPRGRNFYRYWLGCFIGNFVAPARLERNRLARSGAPIWRSELVLWTLLSLVWLALSLALFGIAGGVFFLLQSILAIMQLDLVNYIQHYGLERQRLENGSYEPVAARHAWSQTLYLDDLLLLNLPRHAEHHVRPQQRFELLSLPPEAPSHPYCYAAMILLALVPPLFRHIVDPRLDRLGAATSASLSPATP